MPIVWKWKLVYHSTGRPCRSLRNVSVPLFHKVPFSNTEFRRYPSDRVPFFTPCNSYRLYQWLSIDRGTIYRCHVRYTYDFRMYEPNSTIIFHKRKQSTKICSTQPNIWLVCQNMKRQVKILSQWFDSVLNLIISLSRDSTNNSVFLTLESPSLLEWYIADFSLLFAIIRDIKLTFAFI